MKDQPYISMVRKITLNVINILTVIRHLRHPSLNVSISYNCHRNEKVEKKASFFDRKGIKRMGKDVYKKEEK